MGRQVSCILRVAKNKYNVRGEKKIINKEQKRYNTEKQFIGYIFTDQIYSGSEKKF